MPVETAEIDHRLRHYRDVERQWADSLYDLDEHPTYRLLAAGEMSGKTGRDTNEMMRAAPQLWGWLGLLRTHLDKVESLTEDRGIFGAKTNSEAGLLLTQPSIRLPRAAIPSIVPPEVMQSFVPAPGDSDTLMTSIDVLISLFRRVYEPVRDAVARVDAVWRDLMPRIDAANSSIARAEAVSQRLGMTVPEVKLARQRLDAVKSSVSDDPLSLSANVGPDLDELVSQAARAAGNLERAHGDLDSDLAATDVQIAQLRVLRARAAAAFSEAEAKVIPMGALIRVPSPSVIDGPGGLAHRAAQILGAESGWQERRSDIDRWNHAASRLREQLERALDVNTAPIADREELRGLLRAYRVKASMQVDLPERIVQLGEDAHAELYTRPTDMARARRLLDEFAAGLSGSAT